MKVSISVTRLAIPLSHMPDAELREMRYMPSRLAFPFLLIAIACAAPYSCLEAVTGKRNGVRESAAGAADDRIINLLPPRTAGGSAAYGRL